MFCSNCGTKLPEQAGFCPNCGAKVAREAATVGAQQSGGPQLGAQPYWQPGAGSQPGAQQAGWQQPGWQPADVQAKPSMKWFSFIIYAQLFFSALYNAGTIIMILNGTIYDLDSHSEVERIIYRVFPGMQTLDIVICVVLGLLAAWALVTRWRLAGYYRNGPSMYLALLGVNILVSLAYSGIATVITDINCFNETVSSGLVFSMVMLAVNSVYFNRRKALFMR